MGLLQEGGPLPGPETGLVPNTREWTVRGDTCADKARDFIGEGRLGGEEGQGTLEKSHGLQSRVLWWWISFWVLFSHSFWLRVLPGAVQPRRMSERILGDGRTGGVSFLAFPNSSGWWRLISFLFLTRTSYRKTTHANGYYGAWPGWAVSISVLPLTGSQSQTGLVTEYTYKLQCQLNHQCFIF